MYILLYITLVLLFLYGILINYYAASWRSIPDFHPDDIQDATLKITIIIPARNEAEHIGKCLTSIQHQTYHASLFEVIVVNDHSTDTTESLVKAFPMDNVILINLRDHLDGKKINAYKKKAIDVAIARASGELIVTTDADCIVPPDWLQSIAAFQRQTQAAFIAAPVKIKAGKSLLSVFQSLDFLTLQGITGASVHNRFHNMCNGANLAYLKQIFSDVGGFDGIDKIASGDDMLLMQKIAIAHPKKLFFFKSKDAIVTTEAAESWKAFLHQRIRWASKSGSYTDPKIKSVLLLVYLVNLFILIFFIVGWYNPVWLIFFLVLTAIKTLLEIRFTRMVAKFFDSTALLIYFPLLQPLHMLYIVVAGWLGLFGTYEWKERKVN